MPGRLLWLIAVAVVFATAGLCSSARAQDGGAGVCLAAAMRSEFKLVATNCSAALAGAQAAALPTERRRAMLQRLGEAQFWAHDYQGARMTFGVLASEAPKDAQAFGWRSWTDLRLAAFDEALADGGQGVQNDDNCIVCWRNYGIALFDSGQRREGLAALRHALQLQPDDWFTVHQIAALQESSNDLIEAEQTLDERIAQGVGVDNPVFWVGQDGKPVDPLGLLLAHRGIVRARFSNKAAGALQDLDAAAARGYSEEDQRDQIARVMAYNRLKRYEDALSLADDLLNHKIACKCELYMEKGRALSALGRQDEAQAAYDQAVEYQPLASGTFWARGWFEAAHGRPEQAHDDLTRAIGMDQSLLASFKSEMIGHGFYFGPANATVDPELDDALRACLISPRCSRRVQG